MSFKVVMTKENMGFYFSVVPSNWIVSTTLYWPTHLSGRELYKLRADPNSKPGANWTHLECTIKAVANSFLEGLQLEKTFASFSDTESEERHQRKIGTDNKRIRKKKVVFGEEHENFNEMFEHFATEDTKPFTLSAEEGSPSPTAEHNSILIDEGQHIDDLQHTINIVDASEQICESETAVNTICISDVFANMQNGIANILERLNTFENRFDTFVAKTKNVKLDRILLKTSGEIDITADAQKTDLIQDFKFPLSVVGDVHHLNTKISSDLEFKSQLLSQLVRIGGNSRTTDGGKLIYKLVDHMFQPELMVKYSWTGSSKSSEQKESFQKYGGIVDLLYEVIFIADCRHSKARNEEFLRDKILKHTSQRLDRKRKVKIRNQNDKRICEEVVEIQMTEMQ